jgi:Immunoglobulin I-set domain
MSPPSARLEPGYQLELKCTPPDSLPKARIFWQKNGQDIMSTSSITITQEGSLIIHSAKISDSGNYSCIAENIVGKKLSDLVPVVVRSEKRWSEWSMCGADCRKFRQRNCNARSPDDCQGKEVENIACNDGNCYQPIPESSDRIVYISLIIVSVLCVILAALFAHSRRKKPESIPDYIVTDNGKLNRN